MKTTILSTALIFTLLGCGGGSSSPESNNSQSHSQSHSWSKDEFQKASKDLVVVGEEAIISRSTPIETGGCGFININEINQLAYLSGCEDSNLKERMFTFDISNLNNMQLESIIDDVKFALPLHGDKSNIIATRLDADDYDIDTSDLIFFDMTNPSNPIRITNQMPSNYQLINERFQISKDNNRLYSQLLDLNFNYPENNDFLSVYDISNIDNYELIEEYRPKEIKYLHGVTILSKNDKYLYYYEARDSEDYLHIMDIKNPANEKIISSLKLPFDAWAADKPMRESPSGNLIALIDRDELAFIDVSNVKNPKIISKLTKDNFMISDNIESDFENMSSAVFSPDESKLYIYGFNTVYSNHSKKIEDMETIINNKIAVVDIKNPSHPKYMGKINFSSAKVSYGLTDPKDDNFNAFAPMEISKDGNTIYALFGYGNEDSYKSSVVAIDISTFNEL